MSDSAEKPKAARAKRPNLDDLKLALEHGRDIFKYHAGQRHASLRFYFAVLAAIVGALVTFATAEAKNVPGGLRTALILIVSVAGIVMTHMFRRLDKRNEELVHCDELLLMTVEKKLAETSQQEYFQTVYISDAGLDSKNKPHPVSCDAYQGVLLAHKDATDGHWPWRWFAAQYQNRYGVLVPQMLHLFGLLFVVLPAALLVLYPRKLPAPSPTPEHDEAQMRELKRELEAIRGETRELRAIAEDLVKLKYDPRNGPWPPPPPGARAFTGDADK